MGRAYQISSEYLHDGWWREHSHIVFFFQARTRATSARFITIRLFVANLLDSIWSMHTFQSNSVHQLGMDCPPYAFLIPMLIPRLAISIVHTLNRIHIRKHIILDVLYPHQVMKASKASFRTQIILDMIVFLGTDPNEWLTASVLNQPLVAGKPVRGLEYKKRLFIYCTLAGPGCFLHCK